MATVTAHPRRQLRSDDLFFSGMSAVSLIVVLIGFARTYFLAGLFRAPLPKLLVHIHGAAFTLWIVLFIVQIGLVAARRVDLHRRLGLLGFFLAILMVLLGTLAASDRLARHVAQPGPDSLEECVRSTLCRWPTCSCSLRSCISGTASDSSPRCTSG
ncbi:MAG TPA: hypothetical protein VGF61_23370 [Candidatus Acidoferrum sp.]|jgi:hypothetical protein